MADRMTREEALAIGTPVHPDVAELDALFRNLRSENARLTADRADAEAEAARRTDTQVAIAEALGLRSDATGAEIVDAAKALADLLPVIHRDGGHYVTEHGVAKACADGEAKVLAAYHACDRMKGGDR